MENGVNLDKSINDAVKNKKNKRFIIITLLSLLAIIIVLIAFFFIRYFYRNLVTVNFDNYKVYQYFSGIKYEYEGIATIENDKIVNIDSKGVKVDLDDTPLYFQNIDNEVLFAQDMEIIFPNVRNQNYRIDRLSKIEIDVTDEQEMAYVSLNEEKYPAPLSFVFNGEDMYLFPYSVKVTIDGKDYHLSPLSYIIVKYKDSVEIYNKEEDKYLIIDSLDNDVIAYLDNYKINLSTDMIMYDNSERLLIKNVHKLKKYSGI